jgi:hypothetical protein
MNCYVMKDQCANQKMLSTSSVWLLENQRRRRVKVFRCSFAILRTTIKIPGVVIVLKSSLEGERFVGGGTSGSQEFSIKLL